MTAGLLHLSCVQHHAGTSSDTTLKVDAEETLIPVEQRRICGETEGTERPSLITDSNQHLSEVSTSSLAITPGAYTTLLKDGISVASLDIGIRALPLPINYLKLSSRTGAGCTADGALGH